MFGRVARLPVDVCFGVSADGTLTTSYMKYVSTMKKELQAAYQLAQATSTKLTKVIKRDITRKCVNIAWNLEIKSLFETLAWKESKSLPIAGVQPPVVESQMSDLLVYSLMRASGSGPIKVMHRNHLLTLGQDVRLSPEDDLKPPFSPGALKRRKAKGRKQTPNVDKNDPPVDVPLGEQYSTDSESEYGHYLENLITDKSEQTCAQPEVDVRPTESNTPPHMPEVVVSLPPWWCNSFAQYKSLSN